MSARETKRRVATRWLVIVASVVAASVACISFQEEGDTSLRAAASAKSLPHPMPSFESPEEARRYADAVIEGDTRAIALLDAALEKARTQPGTDPAHVQKLERLRNERAARRAQHLASRP